MLVWCRCGFRAVYCARRVGRRENEIIILCAAPALRNEATEILHEVIPRAIIDVNFADRGVIQMLDHWCFCLAGATPAIYSTRTILLYIEEWHNRK